jgi:glycosyltransferase involved in cell wall biosynthesis
VLPSATEGLSNALLEAMAAGLPVVATRVGAAPDVVEEGVTGRLIPSDDAHALRDALSGLLCDPGARELGARGRATTLARYSLDSVAERLIGLYDELLSSRGRQRAAPRSHTAAQGRGA